MGRLRTGSGLGPMQVLVLSQVALAIGLPFALLPLVRACADPAVMGSDVHRRSTTALLTVVVAVVVLLDLTLLVLGIRGMA